MASNLTPFYGLSQWAGTDNFSRAEFNSDNSKIDTALANLKYAQQAQPWKLITYCQPGEERMHMSLPLNEIELSDYVYMMLIIDLQYSGNIESSHFLRLNNISTNTYYKAGSTENTNYLMKTELKNGYPKKRVIRFAPYENDVYVCCSYESYSGADCGLNNVVATSVTWNNLSSVDYSAASENAPMKTGTGLYLYGMKKA